LHSEEAIYVYEKVLSGEMKVFSPYFFAPERRKERLTTILKHVIENKLGMTPEQAVTSLSLQTLKEYRIEIFFKYICQGRSMTAEEAWIAILKYVYPQLQYPSEEDSAVEIYKKVLSGERTSFPKRYFAEGVLGEKRAIACLRYLCLNVLALQEDSVSRHFRKLSLSEMERILRKHKLWVATDALFLSMLSFIDMAFPEKEVSLL